MPGRGIMLCLLFTALPALAQTAQPTESPGIRRIELSAFPTQALPEISIHPGVSSVFLFDTPLARDGVVLEGQERFRRVALDTDTLTLLPSEAIQDGERLRLTVRFTDPGVPQEASFLLISHRRPTDSQVEIHRAPPCGNPSNEAPKQLLEELQRLQDENARLREPRVLVGLGELVVTEVLDERGISGKSLPHVTRHAGDLPAHGIQARSFRSGTRVTLVLTLQSLGKHGPWSAARATFTGKGGPGPRVIRVWQSEPLTGASSRPHLIVEAEAQPEEHPGTYLLELRDTEGRRSLTLGPVDFPEL